MSDRKWEDLPIDCLVDIFARVGVVSLVYRVPYVCKSWHEATLSPLCWKALIIPDDLPGPTHSDSLSDSFRDRYEQWWIPFNHYMKAFAKIVIRRSRGSANVLVFPPNFPMTDDLLDFIHQECPSLKKLELPYDYFSDAFDELAVL